jgi:NADPH:quinone reductase
MAQTEKSYGSEFKAVWPCAQFKAFGDPAAQLALVNLPDPQPRSGWAVVRVRAASVNPSDVKNVAGQMQGTVLPRVPGRDFSGMVEAGPFDWVGTEVWGTGGLHPGRQPCRADCRS